MSEHPTASWEALQDGNVFYRRHQNYSIPGKLPNLNDFLVAGCRYGGPLGKSAIGERSHVLITFSALMRDTSKVVALQVGRATPAFAKAQIQVYSPAGESILVFSVVINSMM